jgi:hypothetical protein
MVTTARVLIRERAPDEVTALCDRFAMEPPAVIQGRSGQAYPSGQ